MVKIFIFSETKLQAIVPISKIGLWIIYEYQWGKINYNCIVNYVRGIIKSIVKCIQESLLL